MAKIYGNPFQVNYEVLAEVIAYAKKLGPGMLVVKHNDRSNYNITHKSRRDLWDKPSVEVKYDTGG